MFYCFRETFFSCSLLAASSPLLRLLSLLLTRSLSAPWLNNEVINFYLFPQCCWVSASIYWLGSDLNTRSLFFPSVDRDEVEKALRSRYRHERLSAPELTEVSETPEPWQWADLLGQLAELEWMWRGSGCCFVISRSIYLNHMNGKAVYYAASMSHMPDTSISIVVSSVSRFVTFWRAKVNLHWTMRSALCPGSLLDSRMLKEFRVFWDFSVI